MSRCFRRRWRFVIHTVLINIIRIHSSFQKLVTSEIPDSHPSDRKIDPYGQSANANKNKQPYFPLFPLPLNDPPALSSQFTGGNHWLPIKNMWDQKWKNKERRANTKKSHWPNDGGRGDQLLEWTGDLPTCQSSLTTSQSGVDCKIRSNDRSFEK